MNDMSKKSKQHRKLPPVKDKERNIERNVVALNPLLRKSTVHQKSTKARRKADKVQLKKTWFERGASCCISGNWPKPRFLCGTFLKNVAVNKFAVNK